MISVLALLGTLRRKPFLNKKFELKINMYLDHEADQPSISFTVPEGRVQGARRMTKQVGMAPPTMSRHALTAS